MKRFRERPVTLATLSCLSEEPMAEITARVGMNYNIMH